MSQGAGSGTVAGSHVYADNGSYTVTVTVTDDDGAAHTDRLIVTVNNVAPQDVAIAGLETAVRGQTRTFTLTANDPSLVDQAAGFTWTIDWDGDGVVDEQVSGPSGTQISHVYSETGRYEIHVTAEDQDGDVGLAATHTIEVSVMALQADPWLDGGVALVVGGTTNKDVITITRGSLPDTIIASVITPAATGTGIGTEILIGVFRPTDTGFTGSFRKIVSGSTVDTDVIHFPVTATSIGLIRAFGQAGNDAIIVSPSLDTSGVLDGGDGDDVLLGGAGNDVLLGRDGNDVLNGGRGRDLLVGGNGPEVLHGGRGEDILIGGRLNFADEDQALCQVMREWTSERDYAVRANLSGGSGGVNGPYHLIPGDTVLDDDDRDVLAGGRLDQDWYFADTDRVGLLPEDIVFRRIDEVLTEI